MDEMTYDDWVATAAETTAAESGLAAHTEAPTFYRRGETGYSLVSAEYDEAQEVLVSALYRRDDGRPVKVWWR